jgi:hypothetical protein
MHSLREIIYNQIYTVADKHVSEVMSYEVHADANPVTHNTFVYNIVHKPCFDELYESLKSG